MRFFTGLLSVLFLFALTGSGVHAKTWNDGVSAEEPMMLAQGGGGMGRGGDDNGGDNDGGDDDGGDDRGDRGDRGDGGDRDRD